MMIVTDYPHDYGFPTSMTCSTYGCYRHSLTMFSSYSTPYLRILPSTNTQVGGEILLTDAFYIST
jgi:hypothetical protein